MYYIINQSDQIVAVDPQLLAELGVNGIDEFYKKVAIGEITFTPDNEHLVITTGTQKRHYGVTLAPLSGILGDIRLVQLSPESNTETPEGVAPASSTEEISLDAIDLFETKEETAEEESADTSDTADADEKSSTETLTDETEDEALFDLLLPTDTETKINDLGTEDRADDASQSSPIYIDVERISESIGISTEDYNLFLDEYIDTALTFEKALQSDNTKEKEDALNALSHLSNVLQLPYVGEILDEIRNSSDDQRTEAIGAFFSALSRLTTAHFDEERPSVPQQETDTKKEETDTPPQTHAKRPPIDLSDVKPIHFDFQLEEAANDLSLPVELIEEFVNDFIAQAHKETEKMLAAYEQGDLETVQKIGHLLKGTSSNLRITPLSDTLYEIQFNEDIDRVPELVKNYWAHFLSLEKQIELISKK